MYLKRYRRRGYAGAVAGTFLAVGLLSACSSNNGTAAAHNASAPQSSSTPAAQGSSSASSANLAAQAAPDRSLPALTGPTTMAVLAQRVAWYEQQPTALATTTPLPSTPPKNKKYIFFTNAAPISQQYAQGAAEAAAHLGWTGSTIKLGGSPESILQGYAQAISEHPNILIGQGLPGSIIGSELAKAKAAGIATVELAVNQGVGDASELTPTYFADLGRMLSEFIAYDSHLSAHVAIFDTPGFPPATEGVAPLRSYLETICPQCSATYTQLALSSIGTSAPGEIAAYVEAHPNTNYVVCSYGDLCAGVGQALKSAGHGNIKVVTDGGGATNFQAMKLGLEYATIPQPVYQSAWQEIDAAARLMDHAPIPASEQIMPMQVVTQSDITAAALSSPDNIGSVKNYQSQYLKLWHLGS